MRITLPLLVLLMSGCSQQLPNTRDTISPAALNAPYPKLVPLDGLLAKAEAGTSIVSDTKSLEGRVARLKARAAALKGRSIVDGATRLKLLDASARNAARRGI